MTLKKKLLMSIGVVAVLVIGGLVMFNPFTGKDEPRYKAEQDRMVKYLAQNYENIDKVEFKSFTKNTITGYYTSIAEINEDHKITFHEAGLKGEITLDYYSDSFVKQHPQLKNKNADISKIKVIYYSKGE